MSNIFPSSATTSAAAGATSSTASPSPSATSGNGRELYHRSFSSEDSLWSCLWSPTLTPNATQPSQSTFLITSGVEPNIQIWEIYHKHLLSNNSPAAAAALGSSPLAHPIRTLSYESGISCVSLCSAPPSPSAAGLYPSHTCNPLIWSTWMDGTIKSFSPSSGRFLHSIDASASATLHPHPPPPTTTTTIAVASHVSSAGEVWQLVHHPSLGLLASGTSRGQIRVWDVSSAYRTSETEEELTEETSKISSPSLKERQKAVEEIQQSKRGWEGMAKLTTNQTISESSSSSLLAASMAAAGTQNFTMSLAFSSEGELLSSGHYSGLYQLFDVETGKTVASNQMRANIPIRAIHYIPQLSSWSIGDDKGRITFLDKRSATAVGKIEAHSSFITSIISPYQHSNTQSPSTTSPSPSPSSFLAAAVSSLPSSLLLLSSSSDQTIKAHDLRLLTSAASISTSSTSLQIYSESKSPVWNLSPHPNLVNVFAAVTEDAAIRIFTTP